MGGVRGTVVLLAVLECSCGRLGYDTASPDAGPHRADSGPDGSAGEAGPADAGAGDGTTDGGGGGITPIALYRFDEGGGSRVLDSSAVAPALDLSILHGPSIAWRAGAIEFTSAGGRAASLVPATKVIERCTASGEVSIEVWVEPASNVENGPAGIVGLVGAGTSTSLLLGQGHGCTNAGPASVYSLRAQDTGTDPNGCPSLDTADGVATAALVDIVATRDASGTRRIYVDGAMSAEDRHPGALTWDSDDQLVIGAFASNYWLGVVHQVAIYDRALDADAVQRAHEAGLPP